ncbi:MAG: DNA polymerase III subunit gamma/tau [Bacteroidota bacterium]|nr:DNA polymerase III subunit gamma/tau [Bacteroidota bacterium]
MENFIVSARKYRPESFDSVVGQENITRTLKNAIGQNHLAQAYLFCGPRGVGKTTNARIFAKTINCDKLDENLNPCNACESCKAFNEQRSMNIHELDAASNNSVDDIRNLIDQVRIPPQIGHYSVYIIDEVHMLSSSAFNAFLKTLEEPPAHAIFILATTEKHKILPTILSRCQIYDFNRINIQDITNRLKFVADKENVNAEDEALQIIAQKADGALRDALSIFDQLVSFSGNEITYKNTIENLNVLDYDYYFRLTDAFLASDHLESLLIFNEILENGFDGNYFITGLASHFRDLLVTRDTKSTKLLEVGDRIKEKYLTMAGKCSEAFLIKALEIASDCDFRYKTSQNKRLHVELALIRISNIMRKKTSQQNHTQAPAKPTTEPKQPDQPKPSPENHSMEANDNKAEYQKSASGKAPVSKPEQAKPTETKTDKPAQPIQPNNKTTTDTGISIKAELNKKESTVSTKQAAEAQDNTKYVGNDDFDQGKLIEAWLSFAEKHKQQPRLYQNLKKYQPVLKDNYTIEVGMPSESMKNVLISIKSEILNDLQQQLNNTGIDLKVKTTKIKPSVSSIPYTAEEKYKAMVKKNPAIEKLRNDLDMSIR